MTGKRQKNIFFGGLITTAIAHVTYLICRWTSNGCQDHETKQDFDVGSYMGVWYEFARSENIPFEEGECITA